MVPHYPLHEQISEKVCIEVGGCIEHHYSIHFIGKVTLGTSKPWMETRGALGGQLDFATGFGYSEVFGDVLNQLVVVDRPTSYDNYVLSCVVGSVVV